MKRKNEIKNDPIAINFMAIIKSADDYDNP